MHSSVPPLRPVRSDGETARLSRASRKTRLFNPEKWIAPSTNKIVPVNLAGLHSKEFTVSVQVRASGFLTPLGVRTTAPRATGWKKWNEKRYGCYCASGAPFRHRINYLSSCESTAKRKWVITMRCGFIYLSWLKSVAICIYVLLLSCILLVVQHARALFAMPPAWPFCGWLIFNVVPHILCPIRLSVRGMSLMQFNNMFRKKVTLI